MKYLSIFSRGLFDAMEHYHSIDSRLARRFVDVVDRAKRQIIRFPQIGKPLGKFRTFPLKDFPYSFCYQENLDGELVAVILFHHKQRLPHFLRKGK